jgi:hypothetical protein
MSRGDYKWLISIPRDGSLPFKGIVADRMAGRASGRKLDPSGINQMEAATAGKVRFSDHRHPWTSRIPLTTDDNLFNAYVSHPVG